MQQILLKITTDRAAPPCRIGPAFFIPMSKDHVDARNVRLRARGDSDVKLAFVIPVFNDWESARRLLADIASAQLPAVAERQVLFVDDGSIEPIPTDLCVGLVLPPGDSVSVIELACNVGHQRAIALGLAVVEDAMPDHHVLVMDGDGEDRVADIPRLIAALPPGDHGIAAAGRATRSEGLSFRTGYVLYQWLFRVLVGRPISFGNFTLIGPQAVARLVRMPEAWNHIAATLLRSRLPLALVPTARGTRYAGRSSMNTPALVAHGLSAITVFVDYVFARMLMLTAATCLLALFGVLVVAAIRLATDLATPGWATSAIGLFLTIILLSFAMVLIAAVQVIGVRGQPTMHPRMLRPLYVRGLRRLYAPAPVEPAQQALLAS